MDRKVKSMERMFQQLQEYPQYEDIPYAGDFICPHCGGSGHGYYHTPGYGYNKLPDETLIGWCCTNNGYMMVFECPKCFGKFRHHNVTIERNDWNKFKDELWLTWIIQNDIEL